MQSNCTCCPSARVLLLAPTGYGSRYSDDEAPDQRRHANFIWMTKHALFHQ